jgi:hypothetical protein
MLGLFFQVVLEDCLSGDGLQTGSAPPQSQPVQSLPQLRSILLDALDAHCQSAPAKGKKPRKAAAGQKEMLLPIQGKGRAEKKAVKPERSTGRRKAGYVPNRR